MIFNDSLERQADRAAQPDPWIMYIIVHKSKASQESRRDLLASAARAVWQIEEDWADNFKEAFTQWYNHSYRKVALRAKDKEWNQIKDSLDHSLDKDMVLALIPRRKSSQGKLLKKLQTQIPVSNLQPTINAHALASLSALHFILPATSTISIGKEIAQIGHAALMAKSNSSIEAIQEWEKQDRPICIHAAYTQKWKQLQEAAHALTVQDAGLTELAPQSETIITFPIGKAAPALRNLPSL
jgi:peptidyl-tRNA hydrolase